MNKKKWFCSLLIVLGIFSQGLVSLAEEGADEENKEQTSLGETALKFTILGKKGPLKITEVPTMTFYGMREKEESKNAIISSGKLVGKGNLIVSDETRSSTGWTVQTKLTPNHGGLYTYIGNIAMTFNVCLETETLNVDKFDVSLNSINNSATGFSKIAQTTSNYNIPIETKVENLFNVDSEKSMFEYENKVSSPAYIENRIGERLDYIMTWDLVTDPIV